MEDAGRWAHLDAHMPANLRDHVERTFWRPIEAQATLEALIDDPSFYADPGRHPAMFADHGVVHVRDVAGGLVQLVETVDGVLLASRSQARRTFVTAVGVALAYLHDVGMIDMSPVGRRVHPQYPRTPRCGRRRRRSWITCWLPARSATGSTRSRARSHSPSRSRSSRGSC